MKTIYENEYIKVLDNGHNYDFRYVIENKKEHDLNIYLNGMDDYIEIDKSNWIGLFNGEYSDDIIRCLQNENGDYNLIFKREGEERD